MNKYFIIFGVLTSLLILPVATAAGVNNNAYIVNEYQNGTSVTIQITYNNITYQHQKAVVEVISNGNMVYDKNFTGNDMFSVFSYPTLQIVIQVAGTIVYNQFYTPSSTTGSSIAYGILLGVGTGGAFITGFAIGKLKKGKKTEDGEIDTSSTSYPISSDITKYDPMRNLIKKPGDFDIILELSDILHNVYGFTREEAEAILNNDEEKIRQIREKKLHGSEN